MLPRRALNGATRKLYLLVLSLSLLLFQTSLLPPPAFASPPDNAAFAWSATWGAAPGPGTAKPTGIEVGPDGNIYISDAVRNDIQVFTPAGVFMRKIGAAGSEAGEFRAPADVATRGNRIYVADRDNARVQVLDENGATRMQIDGREPVPGGDAVRLPARVAADAAGRIFLLNVSGSTLLRYSEDGALEQRMDDFCPNLQRGCRDLATA
jgi:DNA-binding beta-propeller fold protein YncE